MDSPAGESISAGSRTSSMARAAVGAFSFVSTFFPFSVVAEKFFEHFNASHVRELTVMNALPVARFLLPIVMFALPAPDHFHGIHSVGVFNIRSQYCFIPKFTTKVCSAHFSLMSKQRIRITYATQFSGSFSQRHGAYTHESQIVNISVSVIVSPPPHSTSSGAGA